MSNETNQFYVHPSSYVDEGVQIGKGTKIWHFCHIMAPSVVGENCNMGQNVVVSPDVKLGNNVKVQNNVSIYTGVECEDDVFLGPSMVFTNVYNPRSAVSRKNEYRRTLVKTGATIGANATIVCGIEIGRFAFIGAGAVINRLEHTVSNLMNVVQRTEEARSRIEDADFAAESAAMARANVLVQAGSAMLAQANQSPQYVLALLRG